MSASEDDLSAELHELRAKLAAAQVDAAAGEEAKAKLVDLRAQLVATQADATAAAAAGDGMKAELNELRAQVAAAQADAAAGDDAAAELNELRAQVAAAQADAAAGDEAAAELNELRAQLASAQADAAAGSAQAEATIALLRIEVLAAAQADAQTSRSEDVRLLRESSVSELMPLSGDQKQLESDGTNSSELDTNGVPTSVAAEGESSSWSSQGPLSTQEVPAMVLLETRKRRRDAPLRLLHATRRVVGRAAIKMKCVVNSVTHRAR